MDQNQLPQTMPNQNNPSGNGNQKKKILQKLMDHILNKPSSSVHETISALNDALGAYKNYAKEHDTLHGTGIDNMPAVKPPQVSDNMPVTGPNSLPTSMSLPPHPTQMPVPAPNSMPPVVSKPAMTPPPMSPPAMGQLQKPGQPSQPGNGPMPMPPMPPSQDQMIAGQPQQSNFNRPAPTNSLGIMGH